jgi:hypothetical protein
VYAGYVEGADIASSTIYRLNEEVPGVSTAGATILAFFPSAGAKGAGSFAVTEAE